MEHDCQLTQLCVNAKRTDCHPPAEKRYKPDACDGSMPREYRQRGGAGERPSRDCSAAGVDAASASHRRGPPERAGPAGAALPAEAVLRKHAEACERSKREVAFRSAAVRILECRGVDCEADVEAISRYYGLYEPSAFEWSTLNQAAQLDPGSANLAVSRAETKLGVAKADRRRAETRLRDVRADLRL